MGKLLRQDGVLGAWADHLSPKTIERKRAYALEYNKRYFKTPTGMAANRKNAIAQKGRHPASVKYLQIKITSRNSGRPFIITKEEFCRWYETQDLKCVYCDVVDLSLAGSTSSGKGLRMFSIDRKNSILPYTIENMCFSCWTCNRLKSNYFSAEEWREIAQKYIKPKWVAKAQAAIMAEAA